MAYRAMVRLFGSLLKKFGVVTIFISAGCTKFNRQSKLSESAVNDDRRTRVVKIDDGNGRFPVLITGNGTEQRAYRIECKNGDPVKIVEALGYERNAYKILPVLKSSDPSIASLDVSGSKNPVLSCDSGKIASNLLFKIQYPDKDKYFISFGERQDGKAVLHQIGCNNLIEGLGFSIAQASILSLESARKLTTTADLNDINCVDIFGKGDSGPKSTVDKYIESFPNVPQKKAVSLYAQSIAMAIDPSASEEKRSFAFQQLFHMQDCLRALFGEAGARSKVSDVENLVIDDEPKLLAYLSAIESSSGQVVKLQIKENISTECEF